MKIGVLLGGSSPERDISLKSGKAIISACQQLGHDVVSIDPKDGISYLLEKLESVGFSF